MDCAVSDLDNERQSGLTVIRNATLQDIPALLELGERMHAESPHFNQITFSPEKLEETLANVLNNEAGFLVVAEKDGGIAAVMVAFAFEHWCSTDRVATELALYVEREHRGSMVGARLIKRYLAWAHDMGCKQVTAGVSTGQDVEKTTALYERLGFRQFGTQLEA